MRISEIKPLTAHPVEIRCVKDSGAECTYVPAAKVIGKDNDDIRLFLLLSAACSRGRNER